MSEQFINWNNNIFKFLNVAIRYLKYSTVLTLFGTVALAADTISWGANRISFSEIEFEYVYICTDFEELDPDRFREFYIERFPERSVPVFTADSNLVPDESKAPILIVSVATKPIGQDVLSCLKGNALMEGDWIEAVLKQDQEVGTIPEYLKKIPYGESMSPIILSCTYHHKENIYYSSMITLVKDQGDYDDEMNCSLQLN
ncbi:hypothetical protein [Pelagibacterium halotolerans]|uniref:hypothetical protein n=1 Tax=Pelagibacterium halotolerans TaxID=531813 RepID=UPI00384FB417